MWVREKEGDSSLTSYLSRSVNTPGFNWANANANANHIHSPWKHKKRWKFCSWAEKQLGAAQLWCWRCPAGQEGKCFFILIEKIKSLTWCHRFWMTSLCFYSLSRKTRAQEPLEGGRRKKRKNNERKTISITQEKFSGCNLINNAKRRLRAGEIRPREQISRRSWGRTLFGGYQRLTTLPFCSTPLQTQIKIQYLVIRASKVSCFIGSVFFF